MQVSIGEAKTHLPRLIRTVEAGEAVVITRRGRAVAQLKGLDAPKREVMLGGMKDRVKLFPGWDSPIDSGKFLDWEL